MPPTLDAVIDALVQAQRTHTPTDATPLARTVLTMDDAYLVQDAVWRELGGTEAVARHWKSGAASRSAVVTHAPLPPQGVWPSPADARAWPLHHRLVEAEIALRLGADVNAELAATLTPDRALELIDAMAVAIELADSRWQQAFTAPALLRMADLQSHRALVLGDWQAFAPRDWLAQPCRVQVGNTFTEHPGAHACGDPAWVLPEWLRHVTRDGDTVPAGTVVTTGSWCGALVAQPGDHVVVQFEGIGQAEIRF